MIEILGMIILAVIVYSMIYTLIKGQVLITAAILMLTLVVASGCTSTSTTSNAIPPDVLEGYYQLTIVREQTQSSNDHYYIISPIVVNGYQYEKMYITDSWDAFLKRGDTAYFFCNEGSNAGIGGDNTIKNRHLSCKFGSFTSNTESFK